LHGRDEDRRRDRRAGGAEDEDGFSTGVVAVVTPLFQLVQGSSIRNLIAVFALAALDSQAAIMVQWRSARAD
jgi:hypothetical protein